MTDSMILVIASYSLATIAVALIFILWMDRHIMAKYPRLLTTAVWCMIGAVVVMVAEGFV